MIVLLLIACAGEVDSGPGCELDEGGGHPTWSNFGEGFFLTYCQACHAVDSPSRFDAPDSVTFDTEAEVVPLIPLIREVVIDDETMPLGGGLPAEDLEQLGNYLDCREGMP